MKKNGSENEKIGEEYFSYMNIINICKKRGLKYRFKKRIKWGWKSFYLAVDGRFMGEPQNNEIPMRGVTLPEIPENEKYSVYRKSDLVNFYKSVEN